MALSKRRMTANISSAINMPSKRDKTEEILSVFEKKVEELVPFAHFPVATIPEHERSVFEDVRETVKTYYHREDYYNKLYEISVKHFKTSTPYLPKTIGSYFTGCMTETNLAEKTSDINNGCSLLCAGSMPKPNDWSFCSQNVIWCNLRVYQTPTTLSEVEGMGGDFEFLFLTKVSTSNSAILFLNYKSYEEFPGFTESEKATLKTLKIFHVKLLSYDKTGTEYTDLLAPSDEARGDVSEGTSNHSSLGESPLPPSGEAGKGGRPGIVRVQDIKTRDEDTKATYPRAVLDKLTSARNPIEAAESLVREANPMANIMQKAICACMLALILLLVYCAYRSL